MADLPISGLPAITVVSDSYLLAAVSESVTAQMTVKQVGDAYSSSLSLFPYVGAAEITGSLSITGSTAFTGSNTILGGFKITNFTGFGEPASVQIKTYAANAATNGAWYSWSREFLQMGPINSGTDGTYTMALIPADNYTGVTPVDRPSLFFNANSQIYLNDTDFRIYSPSVRTFTVENMNTVLSGSLNVTGSTQITGSLNVTGSVAAITLYAGVNGFTLGNGNSNGISNIAIGRLSLDSNTSGANNLAVGNTTLNANTSGNDNVAVGQNAMTTNTTGFENTAVGFQSLLSLSTGNNNTAVGANALQVATGQNNTAIGNRAGFYLTSGNNNTFIGKYSGTFGMPAMNNTIIIADGEGNIGYRYSASKAEITGSLGISGSLNLNGSFYIQSSSFFSENTGSSIVSYDTASGQLFHTSYQSALPALFAVGAFYSTGSISTTANQSGSFTYTTSLGINSVVINGNGSHIVVDKSATYNFQFSIQVHNKSQAVNIAIWLKKNGVNVADTATYVDVPSNQKSLIALNLWDTANAGDYYEIAYQTDNNVVTLFETIAATGNIPQSPSVILTVNQVR